MVTIKLADGRTIMAGATVHPQYAYIILRLDADGVVRRPVNYCHTRTHCREVAFNFARDAERLDHVAVLSVQRDAS